MPQVHANNLVIRATLSGREFPFCSGTTAGYIFPVAVIFKRSRSLPPTVATWGDDDNNKNAAGLSCLRNTSYQTKKNKRFVSRVITAFHRQGGRKTLAPAKKPKPTSIAA